MAETSLLIFSLCMQAAIGIMLFITLSKQLYKEKTFKTASYVAAGLSIVGILASLLHLGRPTAFLNSLSHLGTSWLSNEALLSGLFAGIAIVYALVQYLKPDNAGLDLLLRWAGSLIGLAAVFSMGKLYSSTTVPIWQGAHTFIDFYATTLALGALLFIASSLKELQNMDKKIYGAIVLAAVIFQAVSAVPHALSLGKAGMAAQASAAILSGMTMVIVLKWLLILGGAVLLLWPGKQATGSGFKAGHVYLACACLVLGQLIGRYVFYAAIVTTSIGIT
ncbi:anaerobic dimethyl sulfoxide reductase subunit C (anchor subunit) [Desulfitobacterium sp. LBE]|uniref:Anaerobic dimethyl sulfoxide reductase chain C n=1 Tax=bioreactor metagenome TaxID=1076179 RepID=A0A644TDK1_9ZZZZ|nr:MULTISPECIES: DmsC/YnfH family molybdoenzyme membrane anchor subunit [Desulfitobacterium]MEA5025050.1 DmsC/YnfH family molybdoenzyme membrane anchor subunit [Desulfitobacterium hafniense]TWH57186.1 anaerobic dimethyl sulfoxide reductase subunit C (anchor subunit) [Desulfitobacterium sp. LBE]TWH57191.1 anaerobic dimethyl sulfoxide reductase subunit C (anchor subunit) [Desulfitobacterium sp. LBE]